MESDAHWEAPRIPISLPPTATGVSAVLLPTNFDSLNCINLGFISAQCRDR
jgi:hypothetical protein